MIFKCDRCEDLGRRVEILERDRGPYKISEHAIEQLLWKLRDYSAKGGGFPVEMLQKIATQLRDLQLK